MHPKLKEAIEEGQRAKKAVDDAKHKEARARAEAESALAQQRRAELRKKWVDDGHIFALIREAETKGESKISFTDGDACSMLANVLAEVQGVHAVHHTFRYRPSDDYHEVEGDAVDITWDKR